MSSGGGCRLGVAQGGVQACRADAQAFLVAWKAARHAWLPPPPPSCRLFYLPVSRSEYLLHVERQDQELVGRLGLLDHLAGYLSALFGYYLARWRFYSSEDFLAYEEVLLLR